MKKCPVCQKTFDDAMRFCQADGTALIEDAPPIDPYKTVVAHPDEIAAAIPAASGGSEFASGKDEGEVLQIPRESDPLQTMYASEEEIRREMSSEGPTEEQVMDIPPIGDMPPPELPKFNEPSLSPPSFGDMSPPPSPFSTPEPPPKSASDDLSKTDPFAQTSVPIPSPFGEQKAPSFDPPSKFPEYKEPEPAFEPPPLSNQVNKPLAQAEWTPPPSPDPGWQNQPIGQNTPFQPPPAGTGGGQNQTLAIISLVTGILSCLCCFSIITGPAAAVMGFMAKNKADQSPNEFGGRGLALGGIITGIVGTLIGIGFIIFQLFFGGLNILLRSLS